MKYETINPGFFTANRNKLRESLESNSVALVFANYQMPRNGDQFFNYRQNSDFFYLTGIEQEKSILLISTSADKSVKRETLFILRSNKNLEIWEGHKFTLKEAIDISGVRDVKFIDEFESTLHLILTGVENIYLNLPEVPKFKTEVNSRDQDYAAKLREEYPLHTYKRLATLLLKQKLIKSDTELGLIKKACSITREAFIQMMKNIRPGQMEYEVEAQITFDFLRQGAMGHAYAPIVAGGKSACYLHYIENDKECKDGDLLLLDFGAEYANYAADLSRTIPINGKFTKRQKELYESTLRTFKFARSLMKPGTTINEYHKEVLEFSEKEHIQLGLYTAEDVKNNKDENPLWFEYFMHGTSHFLGLDVHDVGDRETLLQPGMVLTCEPGLYISKEQTGIRIENDILITEDGNVDLMEDIPIEVEEIEEIMLSGKQ